MSNVHDIRDAVGAASMVQVAMKALGQHDQRVRDAMLLCGIIELGQGTLDRLNRIVSQTGRDFTPGEDATYSATQDAVEDAQKALLKVTGFSRSEFDRIAGAL